MKPFSPLLIAVPALFSLSACGTGSWSALLDITPESRAPITFDDGCVLELSAVPIVIHGMSLGGSPPTIENTLYDATADEPSLVLEYELTEGRYGTALMDIAPGIATTFHESVDLQLAVDFDSNNGSIGLYGTLTCDNESVELDWVFSPTIEYYCEGKTQIIEDEVTASSFMVDMKQLFRQSTVDQGSDLILGEAVLNADRNLDGYSHLYELSDVLLSTLDGYDDFPLDAIENLYQHIEQNIRRAITFDGKTCAGN